MPDLTSFVYKQDFPIGQASPFLCPSCNEVVTFSVGESRFTCPECNFSAYWMVAMMHTIWTLYGDMRGDKLE